jgi:hypothetical protein
MEYLSHQGIAWGEIFGVLGPAQNLLPGIYSGYAFSGAHILSLLYYLFDFGRKARDVKIKVIQGLKAL